MNENRIFFIKPEAVTAFTKNLKGRANFNDAVSKEQKSGYEPFELVKGTDPMVLRDAQGVLYVEPYKMNYHEGKLNDARYYLDDFAEYLSTRDDVGFLTYQNSYEEGTVLNAPLSGSEPGIGRIISDIHHHLEEGEDMPQEREEINLVYYPPQHLVEELMNWKRQEGKIYTVEEYILKEHLGGDKFLKVPDPAPAVRKFKNS